MVSAIKHVVTVQRGGHIEINDPQLPEGAQAEVIVLVNPRKTPEERLAAFDALQKSLNLTPEAVAERKRQVREERQAWGERIK